MSSKFSKHAGVLHTPRICKEVKDSFRFISMPFNKSMSWYVDITNPMMSLGFDMQGTGTIHQQGNPLQVWKGTIGEPLGDHCKIRMDYDDIVNVVTIHFFAFNGLLAVLARVRSIANIILDEPFGTRIIELPPDPPGGRIFIQLLY